MFGLNYPKANTNIIIKPDQNPTEIFFEQAKRALWLNKILTTVNLSLVLVLILFWNFASGQCWFGWADWVRAGLIIIILIVLGVIKVLSESEKNYYFSIEDFVPDIDEAKRYTRAKLHSRSFIIANVILVLLIIWTATSFRFGQCSKSQTRDEIVYDQVVLIMDALENYKMTNGKYPPREAVMSNRPIKDANNVYLEKVPYPAIGWTFDCQKFNEYFYYQLEEGKSYDLRYCFDESTNDLSAGQHVARPGHIGGFAR